MSQREESFKVHTVKENVLLFFPAPRLFFSTVLAALEEGPRVLFSHVSCSAEHEGERKTKQQPWCLLPALTQDLLFLLKDAHPRPPTILLNNSINREAPLVSKETSGPWVLQRAELEITPCPSGPIFRGLGTLIVLLQ